MAPELEGSDRKDHRVSVSPRRRVSDLRILLWDIDGTLIRSCRAGAFKDYTVPMLEEVFGTAGRLPEMKVSGMTDLQIVGEALRDEGFTNEHIFERIDHLRESYMKAMRKATGNGEQFFELLPGVRETLQALADHPRYQSALLTGNIEPAAYLKMELVGLSEFFTLARRVRRRVSRSPRSSRARRRPHSQTPATRSRARTIHRHRRHAQRHRMRPTLRRPRTSHWHRPFLHPRSATRLQPRRAAPQSLER